MIDPNLLKNLDTGDKKTLIATLESLISQTYVVEHEYKALNESYRSLQQIVEQIIESLPNAIWVLDESGHIFLQNSEAKKIAALIDMLDTDKSDYEIEYERHIYLIKTGHTGKKSIISATDITEQKRGERLQAMGKVAAHLAHEIRNPIGSISILSSTLLGKVRPANKPIVLEIKKALYRVERIIKSTLLFTKGVKAHKSTLSLKKLQEEIEEAFDHYATTKEIDLHISFPDKTIQADFDLLVIVLQNFLYNAIDAIEEAEEEEGTIGMEIEIDKENVLLRIEDSGIPIEDPNILYEPFKTTKTKGHGLGLALSKEIIDAHGGKITLLEEKKGFVIKLPRE